MRLGHAIAERKPDGSQVTEADRAAEGVLVEGLARLFPGTAIAGEEGTVVAGSGGTWYVDPLDGTSAYLEGLGHWGPTVCLVDGDALRLGAFWLPRLREWWFAERGQGAWRDDVRLHPADPGPPQRLHSLYLPSRHHRVGPLPWPGKVRALGSSAAHLAQVAGGGAVATLIPTWAMWDVGCGVLLVEEAGRKVVDRTGAPFDPVARPNQLFLAGAPHALDALVAYLNPS